MPGDGTWETNQNAQPSQDLTSVLARLYEPAELDRLAMALGGGTFPGLGNGQNDTMPNQDSVAPGFPLNLFFVVPKNQVKQRAVKLSFQPGAFRTYFTAGAAHNHAGDAVQTLSVSINNDSTVESAGHVHAMSTFFGNGNAGNLHQYSVALSTDGATTTLVDWNTGELNPPVGEHMYTTKDISIPSDHYHTHAHTNTQHTHTPGTTGTSNAGGSGGVSESTNPDSMGVLVDGVDVTTALGGPFSAAQTDVDISPYVAPGSGIHTVQITTATQLGRISGWVRNSSIVNSLVNV